MIIMLMIFVAVDIIIFNHQYDLSSSSPGDGVFVGWDVEERDPGRGPGSDHRGPQGIPRYHPTEGAARWEVTGESCDHDWCHVIKGDVILTSSIYGKTLLGKGIFTLPPWKSDSYYVWMFGRHTYKNDELFCRDSWSDVYFLSLLLCTCTLYLYVLNFYSSNSSPCWPSWERSLISSSTLRTSRRPCTPVPWKS